MAWIVSNPIWFNAYNQGDFEGGPGTAVPGVIDGFASYGISAEQHHTGAQSFKINLTGSPSTSSSGGSTMGRPLIRFRSNNPLVKGRRYTIKGWVYISSAGSSRPGDIINLNAAASNVQENGPTAVSDTRNKLNQWVEFEVKHIATRSSSVDEAGICFRLVFDPAQVGGQPAGSSPTKGYILYFDTLSVIEETDTPPPPLNVTYTKQNVTAQGGANGSIDVSVTGGSGNYGYSWSDGGGDTQDRLGLTAGSYTVTVRDNVTAATKSVTITITEPALLTVTAQVTDVSVTGGSDGAILLTITGGSGARTIEWADDPTTSGYRPNLEAGTYTVTVEDAITGEVVVLPIIVKEPEPTERIGTLLEVPMLNSLRFVVNPTVPDLVTSFQNTRNTLFRDMKFPNFKCTDYLQKLMQADIPILQFYSDFPMHQIELFDYRSNKFIREFTAELKEQNIGLTDTYPVTIRNNPGTPGTSRVYFQQGAIPIPLEIGDAFDIENNPDGFNNSYLIMDIVMDTTLNYQYLVINKAYALSFSPTTADAVFYVNVTNFNVFEAALPMAGIDEGEYFIRLTAVDDLGNTQFALSEPIDLRQIHLNTNLVEYRNQDNADDITWTTGYIGMVRIPSVFFEEAADGSRSVTRDSAYRLKKINAKKTHVVTLNTVMLPPWLHVKLGCIFDLDVWFINKVQYQSDQDYEKAKYPEKYKLGNSSIDVEEYDFFKQYNTRGISSVNGGFIMQEKGFIQR